MTEETKDRRPSAETAGQDTRHWTTRPQSEAERAQHDQWLYGGGKNATREAYESSIAPQWPDWSFDKQQFGVGLIERLRETHPAISITRRTLERLALETIDQTELFSAVGLQVLDSAPRFEYLDMVVVEEDTGDGSLIPTSLIELRPRAMAVETQVFGDCVADIPEHLFTRPVSNIPHLCHKCHITSYINIGMKLPGGIILKAIQEIPYMKIESRTYILLQGDSLHSLFFGEYFPSAAVEY